MTSPPTTSGAGAHPHLPEIPLPSGWVLGGALVAVAANLRTAMASVPPLVSTITEQLDLSNAAAGALTTLPVLCMGLFAPAAQWLAVRIGPIQSVLAAMACVAIGTFARLWGENLPVLYTATFVAGVGVAVAGTMLPRLVKSLAPPQRAGLFTGCYMLAMMGGATLSSALSVPLEAWLGSWQASLASWAALGVVGFAAWAPLALTAQRHRPPGPAAGVPRVGLPWRHGTAVLLAAYLTVQSWQYYSALTWLAPSYVDLGWTRESAGYLLSAFSFAQLVTGLLGPVLADRITDRRWLLLPLCAVSAASFTAVALVPSAAPWVWALALGFGQGASFSIGLVLLVDYAATPAASGRLTAMAFLVCYGLASAGPFVMGAVRDVTGEFRDVWLIAIALMVVQVALAARLHPRLPKVP